MANKAMTVHDQLNKKTVSVSGCWNFTGSKDKNGYGVFGFRQRRIHRVSYEFYVGKIPDGLFVCHKCDNPSCFNPDHLFLGTPKDNMIDKSIKGRASKFPGEKNPAAKLTNKQRSEIFELRENGLTYSQIAKIYSIAFQTVGKIVNGVRYGISK